MVETKLVAAGVAAVVLSVVGLYIVDKSSSAVNDLISGKLTPEQAYSLITSNPISQLVASSSIKSNISATNPAYSNAKVIFTSEPITNTSVLSQSSPTIIVSPNGIGTYNPLPSNIPSSGQGSLSSPYNVNYGYKGPGWYAIINGTIYGNVRAISSASEFSSAYG
jgi:hypothetical protein